MSHLLLAAAASHDKSKTPFFIAAGVLVGWALLVSAIGIRSTKFPASKLQGRAAIAISVVLVVVTGAMGVVTAKTPPPVPPYSTGVTTDGIGPVFTPVSSSAPPTSGPLKISANPKGLLAFSTTTLASATTHVVVDFTNRSPLPHNFTVANASGKVLGATPTFSGGTRTLTLTLPAGTYTYYCSVPGHEAAGMKGTLTVSGSSSGAAAPAPAAPTNGPLQISANPQGLLAFSTTTLAAATSHVVVDFTNRSPLPHNFTVANASGKVLGATPTFTGGTRTLTLTLAPGTYTYYCSVPGHEAAGMKGTLTVSGSSSGAAGAAAPTNGPLQISANPQGLLAFSTTTLAAATSHVVVDFTNRSPLPHNFTVANASGKVLGATPTFTGATRTLTLTLPAGTYTYYCSVPGHEAAGMKGTLTVH